MKTLDKLAPADIQRYKNLIPSLFGEFIDNEIPIEKKRSNSLNKTNNKLALDLNPFNYSISGELIKKKIQNQNNANFRTSLQRNYFIGSLAKRSKLLTSKNVRKSSFEEDQKDGNKKDGISRVITLQSTIPESDNPNFVQRSLKKKKTIDPQDTVTAEHLSFQITEKEIKETKEKLEEYQEKMRKTQLRYYVFKKITNYKSSLRIAFQKYRSIVQLMEALEEKNEDIKEDKKEKEGEKDIELFKKRIKILKNVLKNRSFKEQKELNKYFIRFYYNSKFAVKMENLNKNSSDNTANSTSNATDNNNNSNNSNFIEVLGNEIKKEEEKKELTPEEIEKAQRKRNKELRDLFYNKVRERQKWLHDHFVKFYYKGLLWAMKTGNIRNNTSSSGSNDTSNTGSNNNNSANNTNNVNNENATQNSTSTTSQPPETSLDNKTSSEIETININKEIEKKEEEKKEEEKKDENNDKKAKIRNMRDRSKGLRRLLSERNKEKTNLLRKYFFKFLSNGILLSLKKTTLRSTKSLIQVDEEGENPENKGEEKKVEEEESNWIIEEKKRRKQEEEQKERELKEKINKKLVIIFNKKDQILCSRLRSCLQRWNLRAKIMGISDLTGGVRKSKKAKGKKKNKKKDDKKDQEKKEENNENKESNESK